MLNVEQLNVLVALGTLSLQIGTVCLAVIFILRKKFQVFSDIAASVGRWGIPISFLLSFAATAMALYYSEVLGFAPCGLCWLQRAFLFPQVVLFAMAFLKKDRGIADYSIVLSIAGAIVALYQHYLQMGGTSVLPCPAIVQAAECSQRILFEFGYITFPFVSFTAFAALIILMVFVRYAGK